MRAPYYVIFDRNGINRFAKTDKFDLKSGEYCVQMVLEIPDSLFITPPIPVVAVTISQDMLMRTLQAQVKALPEYLDAEVVDHGQG